MNNSSISKTLPLNLSHYGLYLFAFSIPISFVPAQFGVGIAFIGWLFDGIINKRWRLFKTKLFIPILFYLIWKFIASIISPRPFESIKGLIDNEWQILIMLMMLFIITDVKILKRIVHLWLFTASIAAIYGIWQTFSGFQLHRPETLTPMGSLFRAVGFNGFYLTFAGFMMSVFFVAICLSFQKEIRNRWSYIVIAVLSFLSVIGTFARSIWFSFLIVVPFFGFTKGKKIGSVILLFFVVIIASILIIVPSVKERAISSIFPSENETRINLWKTSINIITDNPIFGVGDDNFTYYFEKYKVEGFYDTTVHPHNDYLNVLVSSGIPSLVAFLFIWLLIIRYGFVVFKESNDTFLREISLGSILAIIGFMAGGFFQNYYGTYANCWGWWFLAGLTMSSYHLYTEDVRLKS